MAKVFAFPNNLENRARLLAAEINGQRQAIQHREIRHEAGRLGESVIRDGGKRWQGVQVEDTFKSLVMNRLAELRGLSHASRAPVLTLAAGGRP